MLSSPLFSFKASSITVDDPVPGIPVTTIKTILNYFFPLVYSSIDLVLTISGHATHRLKSEASDGGGGRGGCIGVSADGDGVGGFGGGYRLVHDSAQVGGRCSYKKSPSSMIVDFISFVGIISRYSAAYVCFSCSDGFYLLYRQSLTFTYWDATYIFSAK